MQSQWLSCTVNANLCLLFCGDYFQAFEFLPSCLLYQVMWMKRWRRSFPSTCSLELALALDPLLSLHHAVVLVPPPPMENLPPAGLVVHHNPPDHPKVNTAYSSTTGSVQLDHLLRFQSVSAPVYKL